MATKRSREFIRELITANADRKFLEHLLRNFLKGNFFEKERDLTKIIDNSDLFLKHLEDLMDTFLLNEPGDQLRARLIMGRNFFGAPELKCFYRHSPERIKMPRIPFSEDMLKACRNTHMLVADSGMSVENLSNTRYALKNTWHESIIGQSFMKEENEPRWILVRKPRIFDDKYSQEREPSLREMIGVIVMTNVFGGKGTKEKLFLLTTSKTTNPLTNEHGFAGSTIYMYVYDGNIHVCTLWHNVNQVQPSYCSPREKEKEPTMIYLRTE